MAKFLGETVLDIHKTEYAMYSREGWVLFWIRKYSISNHEQWLVDQIARILHGTKVIVSLAKWDDGQEEYRFVLAKPTPQYLKWVEEMRDGENGADTYDWDTGIAP